VGIRRDERIQSVVGLAVAGLVFTGCTATATLASGMADDDDGPFFGADDDAADDDAADDDTTPGDDDSAAGDDDTADDDDTTPGDDDTGDDDAGDDDAGDDDTGPCDGSGSPDADIIQPTNTASFAVGETIHFTASVSDDGDLPTHLLVSWTDQLYAEVEVWSVPGPDAKGVITFTRNDLDEGIHVITLEATDSDLCVGTDSIGLEIVP